MSQTKEQRRLLRLADGFNRKAARLGIAGVVTALELHRLPRVCPYCGIGLEEGQGTFDHTIPFANGGENRIANITRCCLTCNREKFDKTPQELEEYRNLRVQCALPGCDKVYQPRWAEWKAGRARYCSLSHAAKSRFV